MTDPVPRGGSNQGTDAHTHGAERGLDRFEGFSDAVFAIALTLPQLRISSRYVPHDCLPPAGPERPSAWRDDRTRRRDPFPPPGGLKAL